MSTFGIILDVFLIVFILIFGLVGLKKGFFKSLLSFFNWSVCLTISFLVAKYVAKWLNGIYDFNSLIGKGISNSLIKTNADVFGKQICEYESKEALLSAISGVNLTGILGKIVSLIFKNVNVDMTSTVTIANMVGTSVGYLCMVIISAILVFIVLKLALLLLTKFFDNLSRTKIIGGLNRVLGLLFGALKATCIVFVVNFILVGLSLIPTVNKIVTPAINENTHIEKLVYNTTDKIFDKYVIEGKLIQNWINDLWKSRSN